MAAAEPPRLTWEQRREQLLNAARDVFLRYGFSGARTRTIAEYAGVSEALVYQHFASKDELFRDAVLQPLEGLIETLARECERLPELAGPQRRDTSVEIHAAVLESMLEIAPLLGLALFSEQTAGRAFFTEKLEPLLQNATKSVDTSLQGWEHTEVKGSTLVSMMLGTYYWVSLQSTFSGRPVDIEDLTTEVTRLLVRSMRTDRKPATGTDR